MAQNKILSVPKFKTYGFALFQKVLFKDYHMGENDFWRENSISALTRLGDIRKCSTNVDMNVSFYMY